MKPDQMKALRERLDDDDVFKDYIRSLKDQYTHTLWSMAKAGTPSANELLIIMGEMRALTRMESALSIQHKKVKQHG